ncbi:unnamed protein product [Brassica rapa]|uniref:Uncharacterized protein n=1 Tax=Brassica campestris TaxID=3711 RepID=A0A8D9G6Z4_BRACM|nr:unnamed protein product [Brassica rapa]
MAAYAWGFLGVDQMGKTKGIKGELKAQVAEIEKWYPSSLLKSDTETQLPTHEILATLVATISGWTTDDRHTINQATRRKNSQEVGTMKLIPQQKRNFGKMKSLKKGSKAREATVLGQLSL